MKNFYKFGYEKTNFNFFSYFSFWEVFMKKLFPIYSKARIGVVCISTDLSECVRNTIENISIA